MMQGKQDDLEIPADASEIDGEPTSSVAGGRWPVERLKPVLEAMIFAVSDPLAPRRVCDAVEGANVAEVRAAAAALQSDYAERGIRLVEVAGGWQFRTAPEHHAPVRALFKDRPLRLTRAALETLAVIAYKQPATRAEVESVRGVDSSGVLENLVERRIVRIAGRRDVPGRPLVYTTTQYFLELFGLKDLKSLPTLAEIGDELTALADQSEFSEVGDSDAPVLPLAGNADGVARPQGEGEVSDEVPKVRFESAEGHERRSEVGEAEASDTQAPSFED